MIVFAAFLPHTPLLVPAVGKENLKRLASTSEGVRHLAEELYASMPDTIVIISSHSIKHDTAFSINLHDDYLVDLKKFGDLATTARFLPDVAMINMVQRIVRAQEIAITLDSDPTLDYGTGVPLLLLTERLPDVRIVPISYSGLSPKEHVAFGRALQEALVKTNQRVAVLASGDLSHALSSLGPVGYRPQGQEFDNVAIQAVEHVSTSQLLRLDPSDIEAAAECAYRPLLTLFGLLERLNVRPEILSYESPFGVGLLVAQFHLK